MEQKARNALKMILAMHDMPKTVEKIARETLAETDIEAKTLLEAFENCPLHRAPVDANDPASAEELKWFMAGAQARREVPAEWRDVIERHCADLDGTADIVRGISPVFDKTAAEIELAASELRAILASAPAAASTDMVMVPRELLATARRACGIPHPHRVGDRLVVTAELDRLLDELDAIESAPASGKEG